MKLEKLIGERFRERPADCVIDSHALMVKGGYMKYMANGIYSSYLPLKRITHKIEQILREEMDKLDGQEVSFPVVMPASLWEESGRYESVGEELLRFTDRNNAKMVLGMTHEEAAVHLVREYAKSYNKYPFMIYQIQTKFRDEARPRAGLIRVREFTMKDAYSFHTSQEDLNQYYEKCHKAYERIFERAGIPEVVSVASDSGMMGGSLSHEFMLLTPVGEDSIVLCNECDFRANMEAAENISDIARDAVSAELEKVHTPDIHTIEDICKFFGDETCNSCKAVVYQKNLDDTYVVVFIRGDLEINETKLVNYLKDEIHPAIITEECGLNAGYIGPAYAARYVAKNLVAAGFADRCEIQLSYGIGVAQPTSIMVDTFGTGKLADDRIVEIVRENFDLRPAGIIKMLDLRRPIYRQTAAYGHFGRTDIKLPWEALDKVEDLKKYL